MSCYLLVMIITMIAHLGSDDDDDDEGHCLV